MRRPPACTVRIYRSPPTSRRLAPVPTTVPNSLESLNCPVCGRVWCLAGELIRRQARVSQGSGVTGYTRGRCGRVVQPTGRPRRWWKTGEGNPRHAGTPEERQGGGGNNHSSQLGTAGNVWQHHSHGWERSRPQTTAPRRQARSVVGGVCVGSVAGWVGWVAAVGGGGGGGGWIVAGARV